VWAYAITESGLTFGDPAAFSSAAVVSGHVFDIDNNNYSTRGIGTKHWMQTNPRVNCHRKGDPIELLQPDIMLAQALSGAYCVQPNFVLCYYCGLYNWLAVNDLSNIAPFGCHVTTQEDWEDMIAHPGGFDDAAPKCG
jgi:uncharacterized protein (TIGR02145 family)